MNKLFFKLEFRFDKDGIPSFNYGPIDPESFNKSKDKLNAWQHGFVLSLLEEITKWGHKNGKLTPRRLKKFVKVFEKQLQIQQKS